LCTYLYWRTLVPKHWCFSNHGNARLLISMKDAARVNMRISTGIKTPNDTGGQLWECLGCAKKNLLEETFRDMAVIG